MNSQLIDDLEKLHSSLVDIETSNDVLSKLDALGKFVEEGNYQQLSIATPSLAKLSAEKNPGLHVDSKFYESLNDYAETVLALESNAAIEKEAQDKTKAERQNYENRVNQYIGDRIRSIASNAIAQLSQRRAQEVCEHCRYYYVEGYGSKRTHHCSQGFSVFANSNCPAFTKKQV